MGCISHFNAYDTTSKIKIDALHLKSSPMTGIYITTFLQMLKPSIFEFSSSSNDLIIER